MEEGQGSGRLVMDYVPIKGPHQCHVSLTILYSLVKSSVRLIHVGNAIFIMHMSSIFKACRLAFPNDWYDSELAMLRVIKGGQVGSAV